LLSPPPHQQQQQQQQQQEQHIDQQETQRGKQEPGTSSSIGSLSAILGDGFDESNATGEDAAVGHILEKYSERLLSIMAEKLASKLAP
jgi:hypothetical protein